jgi:hypothetical protein
MPFCPTNLILGANYYKKKNGEGLALLLKTGEKIPKHVRKGNAPHSAPSVKTGFAMWNEALTWLREGPQGNIYLPCGFSNFPGYAREEDVCSLYPLIRVRSFLHRFSWVQT